MYLIGTYRDILKVTLITMFLFTLCGKTQNFSKTRLTFTFSQHYLNRRNKYICWDYLQLQIYIYIKCGSIYCSSRTENKPHCVCLICF